LCHKQTWFGKEIKSVVEGVAALETRYTGGKIENLLGGKEKF